MQGVHERLEGFGGHADLAVDRGQNHRAFAVNEHQRPSLISDVVGRCQLQHERLVFPDGQRKLLWASLSTLFHASLSYGYCRMHGLAFASVSRWQLNIVAVSKYESNASLAK